MKMTKSMERWSPLVLALGLLLLWQAFVMVFAIPEFIFPSPWQIGQQFGEFSGPILEAAWKTFWVTMLGFALAIVVGVLLGFLVGSSRVVYSALFPLLVAFNAVPKAAVVPILVVWFGIGLGPGILTAFLISFFPITVNIATGLATLEPGWHSVELWGNCHPDTSEPQWNLPQQSWLEINAEGGAEDPYNNIIYTVEPL